MGNDAAPVTLSAVAAALGSHLPVSLHGTDVPVSDVHMDSRAVTQGSIYVAIRGAQADGHQYIGQAIERGAVAVTVDTPPSIDIPYLEVSDTREALGWIAAAVHNNPADGLALVGITGTNGKTTIAHMLAAMAGGSGREMAVIGTVSANLDDVAASARTTPEASDLQRTLRQLADAGRITDVAVEVSSHAMDMGRVNGTSFDVVAFTNLSQDHLDYHDTMEEYYRTKAGLFTPRWAPQAVIWTDDPWGRRLAGESGIPVFTVGTGRDCDALVEHGEDTPAGSTFSFRVGDRQYEVATALAGRFNVENAAVALACAHLQGWDLEESAVRLGQMSPIPGRYNTISNDLGVWVVVDYAHTPDAISSVIDQTRALISGRVIAIAGAGGDRDQEKRPLMGHALCAADIPIITTDNPRSEDPETILEQVLSGADVTALVEPDRRLAIRKALATARAGDAVLILGKGHETGQEFADRVVPFDDADVARTELALLGATS